MATLMESVWKFPACILAGGLAGRSLSDYHNGGLDEAIAWFPMRLAISLSCLGLWVAFKVWRKRHNQVFR
jgi:hypothetical protein